MNFSLFVVYTSQTRLYIPLYDSLIDEFSFMVCMFPILNIIAYIIVAWIFDTFFERRRVLWKHKISNIYASIISMIINAPIFAFSYSIYHHYGLHYAYITDKGLQYWVLSIVMYLIFYDTLFYWMHRIAHIRWIYNMGHRFHHSFRPVNAYTAQAVDISDTIFEGVIPMLIPLFIFPMHIFTAYTVMSSILVWSCLTHTVVADYSLGPMFITSADHHVHHQLGHRNKNFAFMFTFWDRVCETRVVT